jgi:type IV secretory pathway VirB2 component (pilin)
MTLILKAVNSKDFYWKLLISFCVVAAFIAMADVAQAQAQAAASNNDVIGSTLCNLVANLSGSIARSIATLAIFAVGISLFMGKLNWGTAAMTAAGVAVVFGAAQLVGWLSGDADNSNCPTE